MVIPNQENPLIVIASNRGPFSFKQDKVKNEFLIKRGAGGLVTALAALAQKHDVLWVAAALGKGDFEWSTLHPGAQQVQGITLRLIQPDKKRYRQYYNIIANPLLWFIQHQLWDTPRTPSVDEEVWAAWEQGYVAINRQFADVIVESVKHVTDRPVIILPQDYQLYLVPKFVREKLGDRVQIQPFCHIPWPGPDGWRILPGQMREAVLDSLLASDRVGFQTERDAFNFIQTCRYFLKDAHAHGQRDSIEYHGRKVYACSYPISIDVEKVEALANEQQTHLLKRQVVNFALDNKIIMRTDRIEPSKNILRGLEAFRILLENHPEHRGKVNMLALLVPSRMEVEQYKTYFQEVMGMAGMINAAFSDEIWEPVRIIVGDNYARALAAMQMYDVLLVNPLADGMNLVAKEGVLVNQKNGVLVLSEHAGAFFELGDHALNVSPFDTYGTAEALHQALTMPVQEKEQRAEALRELVRKADVKHWFDRQVQDALMAWSSQSKSISTSVMP